MGFGICSGAVGFVGVRAAICTMERRDPAMRAFNVKLEL